MSYPALELSSAPSVEPITLEEAKLHLRVDQDAEDTWINAAIEAARRSVERDLDQQLISATWIAYFDRFPGEKGIIEIPKPPLQSVSSIVYVDTLEASQTLATSKYQVDAKSKPGRVRPAPDECWPSTEIETLNAVAITFIAGYGDADAIPESIKLEIKARTAEYYADREKLRQELIGTAWHGEI